MSRQALVRGGRRAVLVPSHWSSSRTRPAPADRTGAGCAVNMAIWQRRAPRGVHHNDQGVQYMSIAFGQRCRQAGGRPSTGAAGMHMTTRAPGQLHPLPESPERSHLLTTRRRLVYLEMAPAEAGVISAGTLGACAGL